MITKRLLAPGCPLGSHKMSATLGTITFDCFGWVMFSVVFSVHHEYEIFQPIVSLVAVIMMNGFLSRKDASEMLCHDIAML